ncbi:hypothetical protein KBC40_03770, partial [Patescibacteria group bacterium]|nr:hypothetical protein [Patescibacteria group bacterium]
MNTKKFGFSLVEVILANAVFALLLVSLVGIYLYGQESSMLAGNRNRAILMAEEGIEAVKNIADNAFANLVDGTYGLTTTTNQWNLSGSSDVRDIFTRQVNISTVDSRRKDITSTVTWDQNLQRAGSVSTVTRLSDWTTTVSSRSMMVYSKNTATPFYRLWDGATWGAEQSATNVTGLIQYMVIKFAKDRDEAILGTITNSGDIQVQIWNGATWSTVKTLANVGTTNDGYRGLDIEYETSGDRAMVVFNNANSADPAYTIWDGVSWTAVTPITDPPTTGAPLWIELARNPGGTSDEIAMIFSDANIDVYGMVWDGSTWSTMGAAAVWDATAAIATEKIIDVAYEQNSGEAMFIWGDSVSTDQYYRTWNGTTLSAATLLDISTAGGVANWIKLTPRPNSDELLYGVVDAGSDLNTRKWSGTAWDTVTQHPEHSAGVEGNASQVFDIAFETYGTNAGKAWLVWGNGTTVSAKLWSGTAWGAAATLTGSDDTAYVVLHANPGTGEVFALIYEATASASDDILEWRLTGGGATWSAKNTIWAGAVTT